MTPAELLREITPDDLMAFGLIPELVGRLPVTASVEPLDKQAMIAILTEPKNAIAKQFERLFDLDDVALEFTSEALNTAAEAVYASRDYHSFAEIVRAFKTGPGEIFETERRNTDMGIVINID